MAIDERPPPSGSPDSVRDAMSFVLSSGPAYSPNASRPCRTSDASARWRVTMK